MTPSEGDAAALLPPPSAEPVTHPEEMRASVELRLGQNFALNAAGRLTPAGLICAGIAASAILLSAAALLRAMRRPA